MGGVCRLVLSGQTPCEMCCLTWQVLLMLYTVFLLPLWLSQHWKEVNTLTCVSRGNSDTANLIWEEQNGAYVLDGIHP